MPVHFVVNSGMASNGWDAALVW